MYSPGLLSGLNSPKSFSHSSWHSVQTDASRNHQAFWLASVAWTTWQWELNLIHQWRPGQREHYFAEWHSTLLGMKPKMVLTFLATPPLFLRSHFPFLVSLQSTRVRFSHGLLSLPFCNCFVLFFQLWCRILHFFWLNLVLVFLMVFSSQAPSALGNSQPQTDRLISWSPGFCFSWEIPNLPFCLWLTDHISLGKYCQFFMVRVSTL